MRLALLASILAVSALACARGSAVSDDDLDGNEGKTSKGKKTNTAAPEAPPPGQAPAPVAPVTFTTGKVHGAPLVGYTTNGDNLFVVTPTTVERTMLDGTQPVTFDALAGAVAVATDMKRVFALVDRGTTDDLLSVKLDGSQLQRHAVWNESDGTGTSLSTSNGRVYVTASNASSPTNSVIASTSTADVVGADLSQWHIEEFVDTKEVPPSFMADRMFAVDTFRDSAVRITLVDTTPSVDFIQSQLPEAAVGIANDGVDVYTRTLDGIVKAPTTAGQGAGAAIVVPATICSVIDPGNGTVSELEDTLAIDGATIYAACRAGTNVEVRAYDKTTGQQTKVLATVPFLGGVKHLRVGVNAVYFINQLVAGSPTQSELWRAPR